MRRHAHHEGRKVDCAADRLFSGLLRTLVLGPRALRPDIAAIGSIPIISYKVSKAALHEFTLFIPSHGQKLHPYLETCGVPES